MLSVDMNSYLNWPSNLCIFQIQILSVVDDSVQDLFAIFNEQIFIQIVLDQNEYLRVSIWNKRVVATYLGKNTKKCLRISDYFT